MILYSFRRCPYAIRARLALIHGQISCELREVVLKSKPDHLLQISPKGTVPVMMLPDGSVLEESLAIMQWALINFAQEDRTGWHVEVAHPLVKENDDAFKYWLDRYKYFDRYPEQSQDYYFDQACDFLIKINQALTVSPGKYLAGNGLGFLDAAIFPFVRQFAFVDKPRFDSLAMPNLKQWLDSCLSSELFSVAMFKYKPWQQGEDPVKMQLL